MIVRLDEDGAVVRDADDCGQLHLETDLDEPGLRTALKITATGATIDAETVWLDLGVLRTRARLVATEPDWDQRWSAMVDRAGSKGRLSDDGHAVQVPVERVGAA